MKSSSLHEIIGGAWIFASSGLIQRLDLVHAYDNAAVLPTEKSTLPTDDKE
jgi:hypothetical protein